MKRHSAHLARIVVVLALSLLTMPAHTQTPKAITVNVYPALDTHSISPYIYGSNGQSPDRDKNITARRLGGNRMTGYNWENNASNAGSDYLNESDNFMTYASGINSTDALKPAIVITAFHDTSIAMGCYSLITLQAAGYVSADISGPVSAAETAPSKRWKQVQFAKGSPFALTPDTTDGIVSMDEEVKFLVNRYGKEKSPHRIQGYEVDNEPALWSSTHSRIHPLPLKVGEYISRSVALSKAVKAVDPDAEIFGGVMYGFAEYLNCQSAPDWDSYKSYGTYINAYLANMKDSSTQAGKRLLDVLDLHWYPEAQGVDKSGNLIRITNTQSADSGLLDAREQAPRTLWDSGYVENSWIGKYHSPVALLPWLRASIDKYYPGTKVAFSEMDYGGDSSISGAGAMSDVLGLYGKYGVYFSSYWGSIGSYIGSAYKLYRNYDGERSTFGDIACRASVNDSTLASAYASLDSHDSTKLHLILIYKGVAERPSLTVKINSATAWDTYVLYSVSSDSAGIYSWGLPNHLSGNKIIMESGPQTIYHYVFTSRANTGVAGSQDGEEPELRCTSNGRMTNIHYKTLGRASISVVDLLGKQLKRFDDLDGSGTLLWDGATGVYVVKLEDGSRMKVEKIVHIQ